jgi:isochorismate hydrolase
MKTRYLTPQNIKKMQADFPPPRRKLNLMRSALFILDMQDFFLDVDSHAYIPSAQDILPKLKKLRETYANLGLPLVWTRHLNTDSDAANMSRWWRDIITAEHPLSRISSEFDTSYGKIIEKTQYDAFYKTNLEEYLQKCDVEQIVISGVMTHLCCETTARSAFVRGFEVFFLIDGTAAYNEDYHRATLRNLGYGFANLLLCDEILSLKHQTSAP